MAAVNARRAKPSRSVAVDSARLLAFMRGEWLDKGFSGEARRFLPSLLLGLYVAHLEGRRLSKRDACVLMNADPTTSGPKYISLAEGHGLVDIIRKPPEDRRKDFVVPTRALLERVEQELAALAGTS
ncbi:unnamed protein product, partial [Phaeothamnion confervicola]